MWLHDLEPTKKPRSNFSTRATHIYLKCFSFRAHINVPVNQWLVGSDCFITRILFVCLFGYDCQILTLRKRKWKAHDDCEKDVKVNCLWLFKDPFHLKSKRTQEGQGKPASHNAKWSSGYIMTLLSAVVRPIRRPMRRSYYQDGYAYVSV
jgi:hypothetical protein